MLPTDYRCRTPTSGHEERETERETGRGVEIIVNNINDITIVINENITTIIEVFVDHFPT